MNLLGDFLIGFSYPWRALRILPKRRYRHLTWVPILITAAVLSSTLFFIAVNFAEWTEGILPWWLAWLEWLLLPLLILTTVIIYYFTFVQIANLIASPFNARLCRALMKEDAEAPLAIRTREQSLLADSVGAISREMIKLLIYLSCIIGLGILFLLPIIGILFSPILLYFYAYWAAFEYLDYPMSEAGISLKGIRRNIRAQHSLMLGFGTAQTLLTLIPFLNLIAVPTGAAAATRLYLDQRPVR